MKAKKNYTTTLYRLNWFGFTRYLVALLLLLFVFEASASAAIESGVLFSKVGKQSGTDQNDLGNALSFDGIDDYVSFSDNDNTITTALTLEGWVLCKREAVSGIQFICGKEIGQMEIHVFGTPSGVYNLRFIPTPGFFVDASKVLIPGVWTHISCVFDATSAMAKIFINGNEVSVTITNIQGGALQTTAKSFLLGRRNDYPDYPFEGKIDEFRVWSRALTQNEIRQNMKTVIKDINSQQGLVSYYNFNTGIAGGDNPGLTVVSDIANTYDGGLSGFALTGNTSNWVESYAMVVPEATAATEVTSSGFTAHWIAPTEGVVEKYLLDISTVSNFSTKVEGYDGYDCGVGLSAEVTGLDANTPFYYRVRAEKASVTGQGAYSNTIEVTTMPSTSIESTDQIPEIRALPNPSVDYFVLDGITASTHVLITDLSGRIVRDLLIVPGEKINIHTLPSGVYFVKVKGEIIKIIVETQRVMP